MQLQLQFIFYSLQSFAIFTYDYSKWNTSAPINYKLHLHIAVHREHPNREHIGQAYANKNSWIQVSPESTR